MENTSKTRTPILKSPINNQLDTENQNTHKSIQQVVGGGFCCHEKRNVMKKEVFVVNIFHSIDYFRDSFLLEERWRLLKHKDVIFARHKSSLIANIK